MIRPTRPTDHRGVPQGRARIRVLLLCAVVSAAAGLPALAQEVTVRAEAQPTQVGQGGEVVLSVEITGPSIEQTGPPDISNLEDFDVLGGPSVATRFSPEPRRQ